MAGARTITIRRCGSCGAKLPPGDAVHRRCVACAEADTGPDVPPVYRGVKPADFVDRVRHGVSLTKRRKLAELEALGS